MARGLIVIGAGGHAKVVIDTLLAIGKRPLGVIDPKLKPGDEGPFGVPILGGDEALSAYQPDDIQLVNGVGAMPGSQLRRALHARFSEAGFTFATLVHPRAWVANDVELGDGVQVMAGAVIQPGCRIGPDCIINTHASVDHDCSLAAHCHVAPGAVVCGDVKIGARVHIGCGATIIQGCQLGADSVVGAGAVVTRNIPTATTVYPARSTITHRKGFTHES